MIIKALHRARQLHSNVWVLSITSFLTDISSEMLNNLLPLFLFYVLGVRTTAIGLIDGVAETTASLMKVYSGALSDRLGQRKALAAAGYGLSTLAKPFLYLATNWFWVLGVRFVDRLGKGIRTAPRDALLAGSTTANQHGFAFGLHRAGDTAAAFVGVAIAASIIWYHQAGVSQLTRSTFQWIVLASIIPAFLAVLVLMLGARDIETLSTSNSQASLKIRNWKKLDKRFLSFLGVMVVFTLGNSSDSFIILRAQERGLGILQIMGMLLTFNAVYSLLSSPAGSLSDKIGRRRLILTGWLVYGLIYLGLALARAGWQVWVLFGIYGFYYATTEGVAKALIADLVPQEQRGSAYGLYHAAIGLTNLPASVIAGILWQGLGSWNGLGAQAPFLFGAVMAILAGFLFWILVQT